MFKYLIQMQLKKQKKQSKKRNKLFRYIYIVLVYRFVKRIRLFFRRNFPDVVYLHILEDYSDNSLEHVFRRIEELKKKGYRVRLRKL